MFWGGNLRLSHLVGLLRGGGSATWHRVRSGEGCPSKGQPTRCVWPPGLWDILRSYSQFFEKNTFTDPTERPEDKEELICFGRKLPPAELSRRKLPAAELFKPPPVCLSAVSIWAPKLMLLLSLFMLLNIVCSSMFFPFCTDTVVGKTNRASRCRSLGGEWQIRMKHNYTGELPIISGNCFMSAKVNPSYEFFQNPIKDGKGQNWQKADGTKPEVKGPRGLSIRLSICVNVRPGSGEEWWWKYWKYEHLWVSHHVDVTIRATKANATTVTTT